MGDLVQFVPRADRDANANLKEFIRLAREELTAFGTGGAWEGDRWQHNETVVVFATKTAPIGSHSFTPMAEPFKQFAKAYIRYRYSHRPMKDMCQIMQGLRCVEAGLLAARGRAELAGLNGAVMDVCADRCRAFYASEDTRCHSGYAMQAIFDFVRENGLVPSLPLWRSPFKKPVILTEDLGPAGQAHRNAKLPSNAAMLAVADVFAQANDVESRYFSSIFVLLMATPGRISEVLRLPTDCLQWEPDALGVPQMYLRWRAAKGRGALKKWVVPAMHDVVKEAVRRLLEIGTPAREAAYFAYENPGRFMRHLDCMVDPDEEPERPLVPAEFHAALGLQQVSKIRSPEGSRNWSVVKDIKGLATLAEQGKTSYRDLANFVLGRYSTIFWPYVDEAKTLKVWDALCLSRDNEFHKKFKVKYFSWRIPSANEVNNRMGSTYHADLPLFERFGIKHSDGTNIKLTSHQLRHWLSTMSERAGMDDYTLAQWAGRARVADNRHYDHRTGQEQLDAAREILPLEQPSLLDRFKNRQPATYQELGVDRLGTAKATLYGMCVHDYAMTPCQRQRECMTCKEHVCIKGDHVTLDRVRLLEAQTTLLLQKAQLAHDDGVFGADRWVDNHKWKLAHTKAMRIALEHPQIPNGTLLRIPDGHDPSAVRRALMELGVSDVDSIEAIEPTVVPLALE